MKLNRTPNPLDRSARNGENDNWDIIEGKTREISDKVDNFIGEVSDEAFNKVIKNIELDWRPSVQSFGNLPSNPDIGETRLVESTGYIYRYNGTQWVRIQKIDANLYIETKEILEKKINNVDSKAVLSLSHGFYGGKIVIFQDDDGSIRAKTILRDKIFQPEGVPFSMCVNTSTIGNNGKLSVQDLLDLQDEGHTIFSHAHRHLRYGDEPDDVVDQDFKTARDMLRDWGLRGYDILAYPHGSAKEPTRTIARKYYRAAFSVNSTEYNTMPMPQFYIHRVGLKGTTHQERKNIIDNAPENSLIVFFDHVDETHYDNQSFIDGMRETIQYIKSQNILILNTEDALELKGNILDAGNTTKIFSADKQYVQIGRDGSFEKSYYNNRDINGNTPLGDFPIGESRQFFNYNDAYSRDFSFGAGELVTHRPQSSHYSVGTLYAVGRQLYIEATTNRVHKRRWNHTQGTWHDWELVIGNQYLERRRNVYSSSDPITAYPRNSITTFYYNSAGQGDFPEEAGIVTTYRPEEINWGKQELRGYRTSALYTRFWNSSGQWSPWQSFPRYIGDARITTTNLNVPARSQVKRTLSLSSINLNQVINAQPNTNLPIGIVWNIYASSDGNATLVISNITDNDIAISGEVVWMVQRLGY